MNRCFPSRAMIVVSRMVSAPDRQGRLARTLKDSNGSMILVALMLLTIMSIIGIASINTVVTESFIVRNTAIRKQNIQLVDAVAGEALQRVLDAGLLSNTANDDPSDMEPQIYPLSGVALDWVNHAGAWDTAGNRDLWYDPASGPLLDATNSEAPSTLRRNAGPGVRDVLLARGEWDGIADNSPIRYALVGWRTAPGSSLKLTVATRRTAEVLTEYASETYGLTRLTMGLERDFFN